MNMVTRYDYDVNKESNTRATVDGRFANSLHSIDDSDDGWTKAVTVVEKRRWMLSNDGDRGSQKKVITAL